MDTEAMVTPAPVTGPLRLSPFRGITLAAQRVGDPASARLFARPHDKVPARIDQWQRRRFLRRDDEPAVYLHEYTAGGMTVRGLVGCLDVARRVPGDDQVVWPHEGIHPAQASELAERMRAMHLNPAPILLVHRGRPEVRALLDEVCTTPPAQQFTDQGDRVNRVWAIREDSRLRQLGDGLSGARAMIADGHHRYAAYLRMQEARPGSSADTGLAMLVDQSDTPLFLGAIHRLVRGAGLDAVLAATEGWARAVRHGAQRERALEALGPSTMVVTDGREWATVEVTLDPDRALVEALHQDLLPRLRPRPRTVGYHHTVDDVLGALRGRDAAVLLPAPDFDQVLRRVATGRLLPEKATSFQPKPSLGVLMRSLLD